MKRNDLRNGDIVILRNNDLGLFMAEKEVIIYQTGGYDFVDPVFDDDLTSADGETDFDIMQVYRGYDEVLSFSDYDEGDLVFERDETWEGPVSDRRKAKENESYPQVVKRGITIIAQAFYGNRTMTEIKPDKVDAFILGHLDNRVSDGEKVDRSIIRIPGTDNLVLVYNKYEEESAGNPVDGYNPKPLAVIPEMGIKIFSRCIVCRMNDDGELESLEPEDYGKIMKYLAK